MGGLVAANHLELACVGDLVSITLNGGCIPRSAKKLRALAEAPTRQECERRRDGLCA